MALTSAAGFPYYIALAGDNDYNELLRSHLTVNLLADLSEDGSRFRYADGKWSIKEVAGHIADHERIMIYRALRFSRKDTTVLPGYDQEVLMANAPFESATIRQVLDDLRNVRQSTLSFIKLLTAEQLERKGVAWKFEISVVDILKATIGHELHHVNILKECYLASKK